jgi:hypothetical protein
VTGSSGIVWMCQGCDKPIKGDGWCYLKSRDYRVAGTREQIEDACWNIRHSDCIPEKGHASGYDIEISRMLTWPHLVDWTAHVVLGKCWGPATNWMEIMRSHVARIEQDDDLFRAMTDTEYRFWLTMQDIVGICEHTQWLSGFRDGQPILAQDLYDWHQGARKLLKEHRVDA